MRNFIFITGHIGQDPEVITTNGGAKVANLSIAETVKYTNKEGEKIEKTIWHKLKVWNKLAEVTEKYVKKGSRLNVRGNLDYETYTDSNQVDRTAAVITIAEMDFLDKKPAEA